ncbi:MAG: 50S ribosomal protein L6 [Mycoplasmataceae bacterium]|jgi:large subunit ribosomal protein L6|nr:50S ribosomal protein L6 [Mycoplasmataceae bacterium]
MSRKGNKLLTIPANVNVTITNDRVDFKSPSGNLTVKYPSDLLTIENSNGIIKVIRKNQETKSNVFQGTVASNITNALVGLSKGYEKKLKIVGVGYKANVTGNKLNLAIGFSHPVAFDIPSGLKVACPTPTEILINGFDKIVVGEFAANVRATRKPEPYNGKGIMYSDEIIVRKVGKTAEGAGAATGGASGGTKK